MEHYIEMYVTYYLRNHSTVRLALNERNLSQGVAQLLRLIESHDFAAVMSPEGAFDVTKILRRMSPVVAQS